MKHTVLLGTALQTAILAEMAHGLPQSRRIPDILAQIRKQKLLAKSNDNIGLQDAPVPDGGPTTDDVNVLYFDQVLDHFTTNDNKINVNDQENDTRNDNNGHSTFQQRYFYTSRYVQPKSITGDDHTKNRPTAAFLCVGGEGPSMDATVLTNSVHCTGDMIGLADKLFHEFDWDVHLFALEHRYYGESVPHPSSGEVRKASQHGYLRGDDASSSDNSASNDDNDDEDNEVIVDFTYLSSRQAVLDIVNFVQSDEAKSHFNNNNNSDVKWITFGGSYPGMLSAWSRLLHPDIIHGSVSNSAPVQAKLDFQEYHERVGYDLEDEFIGGSAKCRRIVLEGHEQVVAILDKVEDTREKDGGKGGSGDDTADEDDLDKLATLFNVCDGADSLRASRRNREVFVGDGLIQIPAQGNDPNCEGDMCNIKGICDAIVNEHNSDPGQSSMDILAKISNKQSEMCSNVDYQMYLDYFGTPTLENSNDRAWLYQTCTEFGFYQTCRVDSDCPYGKGYHDVSRDLEECQLWYGISPEDVAKNVQSSLQYYGGWSLQPGKDSSLHKGDGQLLGEKRILFVTGDVDPWTELAVTGNKGNKDHPTYSVLGASHHFWTHEILDSDGDEIEVGREIIYNTVFEWLWSTEEAEEDMMNGHTVSVA